MRIDQVYSEPSAFHPQVETTMSGTETHLANDGKHKWERKKISRVIEQV